MNVQDVAKILLADIGCNTLDPSANANPENGRGLVAGDLQAVTVAINGGLQELWAGAPSNLNSRVESEQLRPPTSVTLTATQYSKTISGFSAYASWMQGCTIRAGGDAWDNEIVSATKLLRPWQGASGSLTASVYADCVPLSADYKNVLSPVYLPNIVDMRVIPSAAEFLLWGTGGDRDKAYAYYWMQKPIGIPQVCYAERRYDATIDGGTTLFLRVKPMPGQAYPITFTALLEPPTIETEDIGDDSSDPGIAVPLPWIESILLPFARQRFTSHPSFDNPIGKVEIQRQYSAAQALLQSFSPKITNEQTGYAR